MKDANGIETPMALKCQLDQQFYATLYFGKFNEGGIHWMTHTKRYKSNFRMFAVVLGYPFSGRASNDDGLKMHDHGV
jgi:hypothetical protein